MKKLVNDFIALVKIDSISGSEDDVAEFLFEYFKKTGSTVKKDSYGNIYVRIDGIGESVLFSAHMDTVEPGRNINPIVRNGFVCSDGKTILGGDNKIAIACIMESIRQLEEKNIVHRPIELVFTRSEEIGNLGAINFNYLLIDSKEGYCFDSSNPVGTIISASPFYERLDIEIAGLSGHAAYPEKALNVIEILGKILPKIKLGKQDKYTVFNIGIITGGDARNTIPGNLALNGEIRSFSEKKLIYHRQKILDIFKSVTKKLGGKCSIKIIRENPGYSFSKNKLSHCIDVMKTLGIKPKVMLSWGVSDANIFNGKKLSCINLGDGGEYSHTTNERIKISEMFKLVKLMMALTSN